MPVLDPHLAGDAVRFRRALGPPTECLAVGAGGSAVTTAGGEPQASTDGDHVRT